MNMIKNKISACVLVRNEEDKISKCLMSVSWCDEIIIADDSSRDQSLKIIKNLIQSKLFRNCPVRVYKRSLNSDFSAQRNFVMSKARNKWILFIDADEIVSEELKMEIRKKIVFGNTKISGYYLKRKDYFLGRILNHGETGKIKFVRLAKKDSGEWRGSVHEKWEVKEPIAILNNPLEHYPHKNVAEFLQKINNYSDIVAQYWKEQGRRSNITEIVFFPIFKFIDNYCLKSGYLDGIPGFIMAAMMSFHSFLVRSKVYLSQKN